MATTKTVTKTAKPTKTTRPAATKRAVSTNGSKPAAAKKIVMPRMAAAKATKAKKTMTADEAFMIAWQHDYETRHKPTKRHA
ncbi:MAG: hypothetical protein IT175_11885 [Acidobacteria bacterium]|nr:hypothetical protein [Acidobacteriota bacterium]